MLMKQSYSPVAAPNRDIVADLIADKRSENTKRAYLNDLKDFFQTMTGEEMSSGLIHRFLTLSRFEATQVVFQYKAQLLEKGLAEATINRRLAALNSLVNYARKIGCCEWNLSDVKGEKVENYRDTSGITVPQMITMLNAPDRSTVKGKRDYALLRLYWELALRRGEIAKMTVEDFDPELMAITVLGKGKGTQKKSMNLSEKTRDALVDWLDTREGLTPSAPLFIGLDRASKGKGITGEGLSKIVQALAKQAGINKKVTPHKLRHTAITAALEATNGNVSMVQKLSRHAKVETVMKYEDQRTNQQKQVTDLLSHLA